MTRKIKRNTNEPKIKPIRVLHFIGHLESGGGETLLYNVFKNIDRHQVKFDFIVNTSKKELLDDKVKLLGGKIIVLLNKEPKSKLLKVILCAYQLFKLLKKEQYRIIHIHCTNGQGLLYAWIAKKAGIPIRIVHIHNSSVEGKAIWLKLFFHNLCKKFFMNAPTDFFAVSSLAAKWLYSDSLIKQNRVKIIKNGIDIEKFKFNEVKRKKIRNILKKRFGLKKIKVILHVGRMEEEKNQFFLLDIFDKINKIDTKNEYRLIMIGKGSLEKKIKEYCKKLSLESKVLFINYTDKVENYMFASDMFLLPSLYEGLGIVAIEAQATGLKVLVSNKIPREAFISQNISSLSLDFDSKKWAYQVIRMLNETEKDDVKYIAERQEGEKDVKKSGFNIKDTANVLEKFYLNKYKSLLKKSL